VLRHFRVTGAGTGVGIAGIRERVRELSGKLTLESDSSGTLVRVAVPIASMAQDGSQ